MRDFSVAATALYMPDSRRLHCDRTGGRGLRAAGLLHCSL